MTITRSAAPCSPRRRRFQPAAPDPCPFDGRAWKRPGRRRRRTLPLWVKRALSGSEYDTPTAGGRGAHRGIICLRADALHRLVREHMNRTFGEEWAVWHHFEHLNVVPDGRGGSALAVEVYANDENLLGWMLAAQEIARRLNCEADFRPLPAEESNRTLEIVFSEPAGDGPRRSGCRLPQIRKRGN